LHSTSARKRDSARKPAPARTREPARILQPLADADEPSNSRKSIGGSRLYSEFLAKGGIRPGSALRHFADKSTLVATSTTSVEFTA
jgi:hypothetical protein